MGSGQDRAAGASEIMSNALGTANTAWGENVALAKAKSARHERGLQMLKNQAIATNISFGNVTPHLEAEGIKHHQGL